MNSMLTECVGLNARAIALMKEGKHVESSLTLRNALEKLEACFYMPKSAQGQRTNHQGASATTPSSGTQPMPTMPAEATAPKVTSNKRSAQDAFVHEKKLLEEEPQHQPQQHTYHSVSIANGWTDKITKASAQNVFTFYPRMFHITSRGQAELHLKKILLILMFNEAMSRHIIAALYLNEHKMNPQKHLGRVLGLYESVIKAARNSFHFQDAREMLCVLVAATNNFGHISSQLLLFTETRDSIDYMIRLLGMSDETSFTTDDVRLFFESVCIFLEGRNLRNAPAA